MSEFQHNPFQILNDRLLRIESLLEQLLAKPTQEIIDPKTPSVVYLNKREVAALASVSVSTVDNWRRAQKITPYYFGASVRFDKKEIEGFFEKIVKTYEP